MADVHVNIRIIGIVQGVGFRPFVYKKALENFISGFVFNDTEGVYIEAEGTSQNIEKFISAIKADPPLLAQMYTVICDEAPLVGYNSFEIRNSQEGRKRTVFYSPDTNICDDCLTEFNNTNDRRYHYPFITCINCGPRFSIIADVPYDRACTSMNTFNMCDDCEREYNDPFNRRHHTQPNGCPRCGPLYAMYDNQGKKLSDSIEDIITKVLEEISCGKILAIKSMGGYHLVANASNDKVIETLRQRKYRPFKPFAVMCGSISKVKEMCYVNSIEEKLLLSKERPIVLLKIKALSVAHNVAPGLTYLGVMLPYTPFHHLLFTKDSDLVLVMTSGNVTDEPIVYEDEDAEQRLSFIADFFVSYNRKIVIQSDDSVYFEALNKPLCIRRSRGYVPIPFRGKEKVSPILAMGGDLKNCFAITKEHYYIMSQYFGDMADPLTIKAFQKNLAHYSKIFEFTPEVVVTDLHPGYITTQEASKYNTQKLQVQHHYAHALAVMEEHDLSEPVIAIIYDGTGFGLDGHIWGSEIFTADQNNFERKAHYSYFPLPGGDRAVKDVWRIGVALLFEVFGKSIPDTFGGTRDEGLLEIIEQRHLNPLTCSVGRLFDGVASLLKVRESVSTEAEAAICLEELAFSHKEAVSPYALNYLTDENSCFVINTAHLVKQIVTDVINNKPTHEIAKRFHITIAENALIMAELIREESSISSVVLSGGSFQNRILLTEIYSGLIKRGFTVFVPQMLPFNDGCLALGQIVFGKNKNNH